MFAGIDLGSTNTKCSLYSNDLKLLASAATPIRYSGEGGIVEFDGEQYVAELTELIGKAREMAGGGEIDAIAFTGQAESLVVLGKDGKPLCPVMSWMDTRSEQEVAEISAAFDPKLVEKLTGQTAVTSSWPASKILWLSRHEEKLFAAADKYLMLKDYVVYALTGKLLGDMSIATFTGYFDIYGKKYWPEMMSFCGIRADQLPELAEPLTVAGPMKAELCKKLGLAKAPLINVGTLDHFAGMIGTGNLTSGQVTLSTGTVMALAVRCQEPVDRNSGIATHYGFVPDSYVMLAVAESGGVSLEWFRKTCMGTMGYGEMNEALTDHGEDELLFLPYLVGANAPEFDPRATGVFYGLSSSVKTEEMAHAVMEGVSFVLRKNCEAMAAKGTVPSSIIATGGGSKSPIWCQLQADITGLPVRVPQEPDAAVLGAAMIAAVSAGRFASLEAAAKDCVAMKAEYLPGRKEYFDRKYKKFTALYEACLAIKDI